MSDRSRIQTHVKPLIGNRQVRALRVADIEKMQVDIVAGKTARKRDGNRRGGKAAGGLRSRDPQFLRSTPCWLMPSATI